MINLLQLTKKQLYVITAVTVLAGIALLIAAGAMLTGAVQSTNSAFSTLDNGPLSDLQKTPAEPTSDTTEPSDAVQPTRDVAGVQPTQPATNVQAAQQAQGKAATPAQPNGPGVPATPAVPSVKDVPAMATCAAGYYPIGPDACHKEPSGCPFYEQTEPKGCNPPADIKCSDATFTNCWYVGTKAE